MSAADHDDEHTATRVTSLAYSPGRQTASEFPLQAQPPQLPRWTWRRHETDDGKELWFALFLPDSLGPATRLVVVLHGMLRNADEYIDDWVDWASTHDRVVVSPRFDAFDWPGSLGYNLGNVFRKEGSNGRLNPDAEWSFTAVEGLARSIAGTLALADGAFDLWGHSAGAQFVHRFGLFRPDAPVRRLIAAGAGWYTTPDPGTDFPYGTRHRKLTISTHDLRRWTARSLILMRGARDTQRDECLRAAPLAEAQGRTRWERAAFMLSAARAFDPDTRWRLVDVPEAGHDHATMAAAAQELLADGDSATKP